MHCSRLWTHIYASFWRAETVYDTKETTDSGANFWPGWTLSSTLDRLDSLSDHAALLWIVFILFALVNACPLLFISSNPLCFQSQFSIRCIASYCNCISCISTGYFFVFCFFAFSLHAYHLFSFPLSFVPLYLFTGSLSLSPDQGNHYHNNTVVDVH